MSRLVAALISIGLVAVTLEPVVRTPDDDGFPLSTFPMFATRRSAQVVISYARGETRDGGSRELSPADLGTGEVMQAFAMLQQAVGAGPAASQALCEAIAARVAVDADDRDVTAIRIVSGRHDAVAYVAAGMRGEATGEVTRARCDVRREPR